MQQEGASVRMRYFERATLLIKRAVLMLILKPFLVSTHCMLADMFTKPVEKSTLHPLPERCDEQSGAGPRGIDRGCVAVGTRVHEEARRLMERLLRRGCERPRLCFPFSAFSDWSVLIATP